MRGRRKTNAIQGLSIQGRWVENPEEVKDEVKRFFNGKFVEENEERLKLEGVIFKRLEEGDNVLIGRPFDEKEVREAVWDYEGGKSPGPDGCNFIFIKKFRYFLNKTSYL